MAASRGSCASTSACTAKTPDVCVHARPMALSCGTPTASLTSSRRTVLVVSSVSRAVPSTFQSSIPRQKPRPKDSWVFWGSALGLIEEAVEFAAGRIEGALLLFRAVVDQWAAVGPNHIMNKFLGRDLS